MMRILAARRLRATEEETAAFDNSRSNELAQLEQQLRRVDLAYRKTDHHLLLECDEDIIECCQDTADELNKLGWKLVIKPGVFTKMTFALKGKNGIVLQRLNNALRIFFTK